MSTISADWSVGTWRKSKVRRRVSTVPPYLVSNFAAMCPRVGNRVRACMPCNIAHAVQSGKPRTHSCSRYVCGSAICTSSSDDNWSGQYACSFESVHLERLIPGLTFHSELYDFDMTYMGLTEDIAVEVERIRAQFAAALWVCHSASSPGAT